MKQQTVNENKTAKLNDKQKKRIAYVKPKQSVIIVNY